MNVKIIWKVLNPKLFKAVFKNSIHTSKTYPVTLSKMDCLIMFEEIITFYSENNTKHINTLPYGQNAEILGV
jgi:hypothetical protein